MRDGPEGKAGAIAALLGSGASTQVGASVGALAFPAIGPIGVVAVRQLVAAVALLWLSRPSPRTWTREQWWPVLVLAGIFAVMNLSLYLAIDRIGLGLAVTLEFLGPLAIALIGSRGRRELAVAGAAGLGVYVLVLPSGSSDLVGIGLALLAAACWAGYIVMNRVAGERLPGVQAPALAATISALLYAPVLVMLITDGRLSGAPLAYALTAGVLSSVVPYATDSLVLRRIPARLFGVLMSTQPGLAALAGLLVLGQVLELHEWLGILIVAGANAVAVGSSGSRGTRVVGTRVLEPVS